VKLAQFYETIAPYLEGRASSEDTLRALYGPTLPRDAHRIAIYERFCRAHRQTATGGVHQVLKEVVVHDAGRSRWDELVEAYFREHPMQHVEINENGAQLAAWLSQRADVPALWSALADFEWWEWQTLVAADSPDDERPDEGPLRIASTVELRPYAWDFVSWLNEEERAPSPPEGDVLVLFWRNRELAARRAVATQTELVLLKQVAENLPIERDATFEDLHGAGIILGRP